MFLDFTTSYFGYKNTLLFKVNAEICDIARSAQPIGNMHSFN